MVHRSILPSSIQVSPNSIAGRSPKTHLFPFPEHSSKDPFSHLAASSGKAGERNGVALTGAPVGRVARCTCRAAERVHGRPHGLLHSGEGQVAKV